MARFLAHHGVAHEIYIPDRITEGYGPDQFTPRPDLVVIGNALSRGNPAVEYVLNTGLPYTSGPQWLADHVLQGRWVVGVAGTHGKTTTTALAAHLFVAAGLDPTTMIGGVPRGGSSWRLGRGGWIVGGLGVWRVGPGG